MSDGLIRVPPGHVGAVVTFLEMDAAPAPAEGPAAPGDSALTLVRWRGIDPGLYRALFRAVGSRWLWFSRLAMPDARLLEVVAEVHEVRGADGATAGMLELDFRTPGECLIRFLGLVPPLAGQGHGRWLLGEALRLAWAPGVRRVRVHTCTLDHPAALPSYLRAGFTAHSRAFEHFPDPRLAGLLPRDCAPQIPLCEDVGGL